MRRKLVAGNWKSNGSWQFAAQLFDSLLGNQTQIPNDVDVALCPPAIYLGQARNLFQDSRITIGAQDVSPFDEGAFTGEISASMLFDLGCHYAIIGHSERRMLLGDSDEMVMIKVEKAVEEGLTAILCLGETLSQRQQGSTLEVCRRQLQSAVAGLSLEQAKRLVIAYEPIWAIGTGETASPEQVQEVHGFLREVLLARFGNYANSIRILYGGSVKAANAEELFALDDVDGGLIGGASLNADEFLAICKFAGNMA